MDYERSRCLDCGHNWNWLSYKWVNTPEKAEHNRINEVQCRRCKGNRVEHWVWANKWWRRCPACDKSRNAIEGDVCPHCREKGNAVSHR
jgi:hypothetical protein